VNSLLFYYKSK